MPLFYQQNINDDTRLGIWHITENEAYFLQNVPLQRSITHPQKRLQHLAGRYLLSQLFPDFPYDEMLIADTRKPFLPDEQYHFSISHCGNYAAALVSRNARVGIDIEITKQKIATIAHKFLSKMERLQFNIGEEKLPNHNLLTLLWSAKEAIYKWWSYGGVDFSKQITIQPFTKANSGLLQAIFRDKENHFELQLQYMQFGEISLVWVADKRA